MTRKLFVIGNGFDFHHHIPSNNSDFGCYLEAVDPTLQEYLFIDKDFWNCLEAQLATLPKTLS